MLKQVSTFVALVMSLGGSLLLCGCNQTTGPNAAPIAAVPNPSTPPVADAAVNPGLPEGAACTTAYVRYQTVLKADVETGNVEQPVYEKIQSELARASTACAEGRDAEARSLIRASQQKHGYHT